MTMTNLGTGQTTNPGPYPNQPVRLTQKGSFVNNNTTSTINGTVIQERQALSKALRPKADN